MASEMVEKWAAAIESGACRLDDMAERGEYWSTVDDSERVYPADEAKLCREAIAWLRAQAEEKHDE